MVLLATVAFAGTDVQLLDSNGNPLKPNQLDSVNISKSCGDCHDVAANAKTVHFNRKSHSSDPESASCLSCHVSSKGAFNADGTLKSMATAIDDAACLNCHSDIELQPKHPGDGHDGMKCIDCHKNAGHKTSGAASCQSCHFSGKSALTPTHSGIPSLHFKRIACESCHISQKSSGYVVKDEMIVPVDDTGVIIHHGVDNKTKCLGKNGCADCHSPASKFFFGTTVIQGSDGNPIKMPNYKSMGLDGRELEIGFLREDYIKRYGGWLFVLVLAMSVMHYLLFGPHRVHVVKGDQSVQRFALYERMIHWLAMLTFAFLSLSGIAFLLHRESPMSAIRAVHGQVGVAFVLTLIALVAIWWRHAMFVPCDKEWICKLGGYLWVKADCPAGKFNAGQKLFFWLIAVLGGLVISGTGIALILDKNIAASWVYTLHDLAALALIAGVLGHAYLGVFANPGTVTSIISGRVKRSWAEKHHSEWAKKLTEKNSGH